MLGVFSTLLLAFAPSYAAAATCLTGYNWTYNSQGQSPCDLAASLLGVCVPAGGGILSLSLLILAVTPLRQVPCLHYPRDIIMLGQHSNPAMNSRETLRWSAYATNCSTVYVQTFPDPLPVGVRVPNYAYLDVTIVDGFDPSLAQAAGGAESVGAPSATTSALASTPTSQQSPKKKSNAGAIAGGVVGGVALLGILVIVVVWLLLRRRPSSEPLRQSQFSYESSAKTEQQGYT
ncbi:hypothetical protein K443DRAFT_7462 [Laccaria amethystina LaAM-08-1]|uniref:Protein ROT1 n=1 Tax=Laccaria amethystina LaAM-08-1 TaxID=1095629 RepID=A0A0C9WQQ2_9AGAR|nr:hypothetical protein K443DRAFT_7462 [Laccaria amethystina LaAM-08-1]